MLCKRSKSFPTQLEILHQKSINGSTGLHKLQSLASAWALHVVGLLFFGTTQFGLFLMLTAIIAVGVLPLSYWLGSWKFRRKPCYCEFRNPKWLTLKSFYRHYLKVRGHVCGFVFSISFFFFFVGCVCPVVSCRLVRLERSDTIRCIKSCQPNDVACVLDPTHSVSHTFISLPTFRDFMRPEGRHKSICCLLENISEYHETVYDKTPLKRKKTKRL